MFPVCWTGSGRNYAGDDEPGWTFWSPRGASASCGSRRPLGPVGLDELAERDVVRDRGMTELFAPDPLGLECCGVALAVKRAAAPLSALPRAELPLAVGLAADVQ